jgi:hypothetical protein
MSDDSGWIYGGWKKEGVHTKEWMRKTQEFMDGAFSLANNGGIKCRCIRCRNSFCEGKRTLSLRLYKVGFMTGYEVCIHHGESVRQTASVAKDDDNMSDDRMDEMFDPIQLEFGTNSEDPPTLEV